MHHEWKINPLIVITLELKGLHMPPSMNQLVSTFQLFETTIKHTFKAINTSAIHYVGSILLHKRTIEKTNQYP